MKSAPKFSSRLVRQQTLLFSIFLNIFVLVVSPLTNAQNLSENNYDSRTDSAINVVEFKAFTDKDTVSIAWRTEYEKDSLGYRIYRESNGEKIPLNEQLIAGTILQVRQGTPIIGGTAHRVIDRQVSSSEASFYYYWLEAVALDGSTNWFGPVAVETFHEGLADLADFPETVIVNPSDRTSDGFLQTETAKPSAKTADSAGSNLQTAVTGNGYSLAENGAALKIEVAQDGWYQISAAQLTQAGFNINTDRRYWQLWNGLTEQSLKVNSDGSIEFYGKQQDTVQTDGRIYWLVVGTRAGLRVLSQAATYNSSYTTKWYTSSVLRTDKTLRATSVINGTLENFYSGVVYSTALEQTITVNNVAASGGTTATVEVVLQGLSFYPHSVRISLNGTVLGTTNFAYVDRKVQTYTVPLSSLQEGTNTISLQAIASTNDTSLLESVRITYPKETKAVNDRLEFSLASRQTVKLEGFTNSPIRVFDITAANAVKMWTLTGMMQPDGKYAVTLPSDSKTRILVAQTAQTPYLQPRSIKLNQASTWSRATNAADFIIVAPKDWHTVLAPLKTQRESEGYRVVMVDPEDIFDEFGYGERSAPALKAFFQNAYNTWVLPKPKYVLFVGDASTDPRNYNGQGGLAIDIIPTQQVDTVLMEATSDETMVDFTGDNVGELMTGRWPFRTAAEVQNQVNRLLNSETFPANNSNGRGALYVSDSGIGWDFTGSNHYLQTNFIPQITPTFITRDDSDAATVRQQIINKMNSGVGLIHYFGHGLIGQWTGAGILRSTDLENFTNGTRKPLVMLSTCYNGTYAEPGVNPMAKAFLKSPNGGAFATIASSTQPNADTEEIMSRAFWQKAQTGSTLGEAMRFSKQAVYDNDVRLSYHTFGDPTAKYFTTN